MDDLLSKTQQNTYYTVWRDIQLSNSRINTVCNCFLTFRVHKSTTTKKYVISILPLNYNTTTLSSDNWFWIFIVRKYFIILIFMTTTFCLITRRLSYYKSFKKFWSNIYRQKKTIITDFLWQTLGSLNKGIHQNLKVYCTIFFRIIIPEPEK